MQRLGCNDFSSRGPLETRGVRRESDTVEWKRSCYTANGGSSSIASHPSCHYVWPNVVINLYGRARFGIPSMRVNYEHGWMLDDNIELSSISSDSNLHFTRPIPAKTKHHTPFSVLIPLLQCTPISAINLVRVKYEARLQAMSDH